MGDSGANRIGQPSEVPAQHQPRVCATDAEIGVRKSYDHPGATTLS